MNPLDAKQATLGLMEEHGLLDKGWTFKWSHATRRFGYCNSYLRVIALSKPLVALNDEARVTNTILHEIAHALTDPSLPPHGKAWKAKAISLGCDGKARCTDAVMVEPRFRGRCPSCPLTIKRHRTNRRLRCAVCHRLGRPALLIWSRVQ